MLASGVVWWVSAHIFLQTPDSGTAVSSRAGPSVLTLEMLCSFGGRSWFMALPALGHVPLPAGATDSGSRVQHQSISHVILVCAPPGWGILGEPVGSLNWDLPWSRRGI